MNDKIQNRQKLIPISETIIFCGLQNALLEFRINAGDQILKEHFKFATKNTTYINKTTQNDLIDCCGNVISDKIIQKVHLSKFYSILADETTEVSISEQFSFGVRYFDSNTCSVREHFLGFTKVEHVTGEYLADTILQILKEKNLDLALLRGQGYDGAANMSGAFKGVQSRIASLQPLAFYTHCANHRLNLVLSKESTVLSICNTVGIITNIYSFLRESALKTQLLNEKITELFPHQKAVKAKKLCETRWVERHDGILHFLEILPAIIVTLDELSLSNYTGSNAQSLSAAICKCEFLISLKILIKFLAITLPLSIQLQTTIKENSKTEFKNIFEETTIIAGKMDVDKRIPRVTKTQCHRANAQPQSTDLSEFYHVNYFLPYLDYLMSELNSHDKILNAAQMYEADLPHSIKALRGELNLWKQFWKNKPEKSDSSMEAFKYASMFPNIKCL
ncbi:hypothetical protein AGLY_010963 [Aphis glycines]|uniref:DUF4371 domain-containing protein n=1 Tax=Aphis glycines TaxID=307491 RepID=A0A6G0TE87_APHGL|nr:hypothetical protein AGLY_010963 [Aphis glycines]